jgi:hypothetical protein
MRRINGIDPTAATGSAKRLPEATSRRRFLGLGAQVVSYSGEPNPETFALSFHKHSGGHRNESLHRVKVFQTALAGQPQPVLELSNFQGSSRTASAAQAASFKLTSKHAARY